MKTWLRLLLVLISVGGGFAGVAVMAGAFVTVTGATRWIAVVGGLLYAFIAASGLIFVHDSRRTGPLLVGMALQVPWVSSPVFVYQLFAGCGVGVGIVADNIGTPSLWIRINTETTYIGSMAELRLFESAPWRLGVNLVALVLLILVWRARSKKSTLPSTETPNSSVVGRPSRP